MNHNREEPGLDLELKYSVSHLGAKSQDQELKFNTSFRSPLCCFISVYRRVGGGLPVGLHPETDAAEEIGLRTEGSTVSNVSTVLLRTLESRTVVLNMQPPLVAYLQPPNCYSFTRLVRLGRKCIAGLVSMATIHSLLLATRCCERNFNCSLLVLEQFTY